MNTFEIQGAFGYSSPDAPLTVWISLSQAPFGDPPLLSKEEKGGEKGKEMKEPREELLGTMVLLSHSQFAEIFVVSF